MPESHRPLPSQPSLEQQKKQAKDLLHSLRAGDAASLARVRRHLPDKAKLTLADAQLVIAREYGFTSWAELKQHIETAASDVPADMAAAFRSACQARDVPHVRELLERYAEARALLDAPIFSFDSPALAHFAADTDVTMVDLLLEFGADPNRRTSWWAGGFHPLHSASPQAAERLIRAGATIDACAAAHLDRIDVLAAILDSEPARVHERGGDGKMPLHFARSREVVDLLLARGADIDARDIDHRSTAAQWMLEQRRGAGRYELARYLVGRGATADIFLAAALGLTARLHTLLRNEPQLLDARTAQGEYGAQPPSSYHIYFWSIGPNLSPLQVAAKFEQTQALEVIRAYASPKQRFLEACASARAEDAHRLLREHPRLMSELTPTDHRTLADAAWTANAPAVKLMMDFGFDPAVRGHDGGTALHLAAFEGSADSVRAILGVGRGRRLVADKDPHYDGTPLGWCIYGAMHSGNPRADHVTVIRLLLEAGAEPPREISELPAPLRDVIREYGRVH